MENNEIDTLKLDKFTSFNRFITVCHNESLKNKWWDDAISTEGELLRLRTAYYLISSEIYEMAEAERKDRGYGYTKEELIDLLNDYESNRLSDVQYAHKFKGNQKDTITDELADTLIRLGDLFGYLHNKSHTLKYDDKDMLERDLISFVNENITEVYRACPNLVIAAGFTCRSLGLEPSIDRIKSESITRFVEMMSINLISIEQLLLAVKAKLLYNRTRGAKHGNLKH